jgi:type IV pilus assembly protein PilB
MVLVTGPTGSGKTNTLYSALSTLNKVDVNISTAEDPVEFNLDGVNQVNMNEDVGLTFAASLRSFLRQDPDIILVGEIRDFETGEIAIKAALTGHMVLSTLHTNDAPSTITRLLNMGIESFLVTASLNLVVAQRLARRICSNCAEPDLEVTKEQLIEMGMTPERANVKLVKKGKGCAKCNNTGFKGRVGIYEVLPMVEVIKEAVLNGVSSTELKQIAIEEAGFKSMRMSALDKLLEGVTSVSEVLRVSAAD